MMQENGDNRDPIQRLALHELRDRVDGDEELMREVLAIYLEDTPTLLDTLRQALETKQTEAVAKAAHTLKGSSANIAAERLRSQAYQLEQQARAGDLNRAAALFETIQSEFQELEKIVKRYLA